MHKQAGTQFARHRHSAIVGHYYSTVLMLSMLVGDLTFIHAFTNCSKTALSGTYSCCRAVLSIVLNHISMIISSCKACNCKRNALERNMIVFNYMYTTTTHISNNDTKQ